LRPDADGDVWLADEPVAMIDWYGASAYAAWFASKEGSAWRLPMEQEWEKAARGVDGRFFPWGDYLDPSWCCMKDSHEGVLGPSIVQNFPVDTSVYGVRGMGGNNRDWCSDIYTVVAPRAALVEGPTVVASDSGRADVERCYRGGAWIDKASGCRIAARDRNAPEYRNAYLGVRLVRSLG